jgi:RNA polymerase sigma-70 factor (ECF subfamily)
MNTTDLHIATLVHRAREGDAEALGELLEKHRPYLRLLAERQLDPRLEARVDASDIVQQTCLSVHRAIREFTGDDPAQFLAWLRQIHERNIRNAFRDHIRLQKRSATRERVPTRDETGAIDAWGAAQVSSPAPEEFRKALDKSLASLPIMLWLRPLATSEACLRCCTAGTDTVQRGA